MLAVHVIHYMSKWKTKESSGNTVRMQSHTVQEEQSFPLTGRNRTDPPCSVDRPRSQPGGGRPATHPPAGSVTDDNRRRRQTRRAKQYWPIRWASNKDQFNMCGKWQWCECSLTKHDKHVASTSHYAQLMHINYGNCTIPAWQCLKTDVDNNIIIMLLPHALISTSAETNAINYR